MADQSKAEPVRVETPSWRRNGPQVWYDAWRKTDRVLRYTGQCVIDGRRTYAFDDGENDPRGVLGDHAGDPLEAEEYDKVGPTVPLCFMCANDYDRYKRAMKIAERRWRDPAEEEDDGLSMESQYPRDIEDGEGLGLHRPSYGE